MKANELGRAIAAYPSILKPLLAACNVAGRAIERDLGIKGLNTYEPRLTEENALVIAGYIKSFLPKDIELNALVHIDRVQFIDKEIRALKGNWEKLIVESLNRTLKGFRKRKFSIDDEEFEIDAAWPASDDIDIAVDVKRIEARRDIHKRCDEIVNKALKFKKRFPKGKFAAIVYYPFVSEHQNVRSRLSSQAINTVYFAGASPESIRTSTEMLLAELREETP